MLTDTKCRTAAPRDKLYRLSDSKGLYLEVKPNGGKAWRYRFELGGKESLFGIGDYVIPKGGDGWKLPPHRGRWQSTQMFSRRGLVVLRR